MPVISDPQICKQVFPGGKTSLEHDTYLILVGEQTEIIAS